MMAAAPVQAVMPALALPEMVLPRTVPRARLCTTMPPSEPSLIELLRIIGSLPSSRTSIAASMQPFKSLPCTVGRPQSKMKIR